MKCPKILSLLLMILLLSTGYASAAPSQTLKIAAGDPEDSEMGVVGNAFKEYIEEKTKGDVEIQCFYSGSLGDESECLRNVQKGTLPMAMENAGFKVNPKLTGLYEMHHALGTADNELPLEYYSTATTSTFACAGSPR